MEFANTDELNVECTIIILSYNSREVTDVCLARAREAVSYGETQMRKKTEIIVVDNGSQDGSAEMIRQKYPDVKLIALEKNVGYSRGNNRALKTCTSPFILLLNSDAYLRKETLVKALRYMTTHPSCDILSARLVYPDGGFQAFSGYLPTPWRTVRWAFMGESIPLVKNWIEPIYQYKESFYAQAKQLDWATTGFFFMRRAVYDKTGGFDERLFLYMEDVEWCQRIKQEHFTICYTPEIDIVHLGGFSAKKLPSVELLQRHMEGTRHFQSVHYPKTKSFVMACVLFGMGLRALLYVLLLQTKKAYPYWRVICPQRKSL